VMGLDVEPHHYSSCGLGDSLPILLLETCSVVFG
jgi:hypothetical protein